MNREEKEEEEQGARIQKLLSHLRVLFCTSDGRSCSVSSYSFLCKIIESSGCVGCYREPTLNTKSVDPSKGSIKQGEVVKKQGEVVKKRSTSEDFWTTSTLDMDNSAVQSQGSISSTSQTNQAAVPLSGSSKTGNHTEFVNHGLTLWNQTRQHWVGNKRSETRTQQLREPKMSWNATYESLLGSNKPFRQPIPLSEMVDFLVDIWEQEGLYD
ncbi:hypothetical protein RIF29_28645 [Crotalaria pallida]|uniref:Gag1-like clamp domain-containing protein n=1 Tax=Crotalaria pallida TaxID=3830 RepID=A0AAN9ED67_CROPI